MEKTPKFDYSDIKWQENGKLKLVIVVGTRPEIIRLAAVINKCRKYFDVILAHTGQNYDYNLNGIFHFFYFSTGSKKVSGRLGSKISLQYITVTRSCVSDKLMILWV